MSEHETEPLLQPTFTRLHNFGNYGDSLSTSQASDDSRENQLPSVSARVNPFLRMDSSDSMPHASPSLTDENSDDWRLQEIPPGIICTMVYHYRVLVQGWTKVEVGGL